MNGTTMKQNKKQSKRGTKEFEGGEVGMRIHEMTISMVADNGLMPVTVTHNSPKRIVSGARVRFGWFFIRIGARILYGRRWEYEAEG